MKIARNLLTFVGSFSEEKETPTYAISICSSSVDPIQSFVLSIKLLYLHSFSLFSKAWILVEYLLNECYLHNSNILPPLVEV